MLFRVPVEADAVWAFFRSGDRDAMLAALGPAPQHPNAPELLAHLQGLVERSRQLAPRHLDTLLPRLQAEGATPQPLAELKTAFNRAQERWEHQAAEMDTLEGLNTELAFQGYPDTFDIARKLQRSVTLYVGPPNSGKTYAAFERLAQASSTVHTWPRCAFLALGRP